MKNLRLFLLLALLLPAARAVTVIYPVEGIADLWRLADEEFREKYSGINITGLGMSDEGWYVRYRHENLTYLFGPLSDREAARRAMWELEAVRDAVIRERPTLSSSRVDVVKFSYSGVYGTRGNQPYDGKGDPGAKDVDGKLLGGTGDMDGDGVQDNQDSDMDGDGIPNELDADMDGDGIPNELDADMDGDGIPNDQDGDMDGDGIPNSQDGRPKQYDVTAENQSGGSSQGGGQKGQKNGQQGQQSGQDGQTSSQTSQNQKSQSPSKDNQQAGQPGQPSQSSQSGQSGQSGQPGQPGQPSQQQQQQKKQQQGSSLNIVELLKWILGIR